MLTLLFVIARALALALRGHQELVSENLALRQQLTVVKRTSKRPHLQTRDRLFWIALVLLSHHCRCIVHINVTDHPTATWSAQQVVDAFPDDTAPRWLHRDRDRIYGDVFQRRLAGMGIAEVVSAPASPWQNPYVERLIGSIRRDESVSIT